MGKIINLGQARKQRRRAARERRAAQNRSLHGRPGHERKLTRAQQEALVRHLDGHRRTGPGRKDGAPE